MASSGTKHDTAVAAHIKRGIYMWKSAYTWPRESSLACDVSPTDEYVLVPTTISYLHRVKYTHSRLILTANTCTNVDTQISQRLCKNHDKFNLMNKTKLPSDLNVNTVQSHDKFNLIENIIHHWRQGIYVFNLCSCQINQDLRTYKHMGEREKCVKPFVELCRGDCARLFQVGDQKGKGRGRHKVGRGVGRRL